MKTDDERVRQLTLQGWTAAAIAAELETTERTITRARKRTGCAKPAPRWLTPDEIELAEEMLADGAPVAEIERTLGRPPGSLKNRFAGRHWTKKQSGIWARELTRILREAAPQ